VESVKFSKPQKSLAPLIQVDNLGK